MNEQNAHEIERGCEACIEALAECYRLSGADDDGNEGWRIAPFAVAEVRRLRVESDAEIERLTAQVTELREENDALRFPCGNDRRIPGDPDESWCCDCCGDLHEAKGRIEDLTEENERMAGSLQVLNEDYEKMSRLVTTLRSQVTELQAANTREVERRREAEAKVDDVLQSVIAEIARAVAKFPTWPTDPLHAVAVLGEEYGELQKAILQHVYEPHKSTAADVREEAIQTAAMAIRFARSLDRYDYARCEQHSQGGAE
jgi:hypothetical protein